MLPLINTWNNHDILKGKIGYGQDTVVNTSTQRKSLSNQVCDRISKKDQWACNCGGAFLSFNLGAAFEKKCEAMDGKCTSWPHDDKCTIIVRCICIPSSVMSWRVMCGRENLQFEDTYTVELTMSIYVRAPWLGGIINHEFLVVSHN